MSYLGRYQLGDFVPLLVRTKDEDGIITIPTVTSDQAPIAAIWSDSAKVENLRLPVVDLSLGLFGGRVQLTSNYAVGQYFAAATWTVGGKTVVGDAVFTFEVVAGGDSDGAVIAMKEYLRPEAVNLVFEKDGGKVLCGRNPA